MKNLIKKILRESNELDWVRDIVIDERITKYNVEVGMRVRMNPDSEFVHQTKPNGHGTVSHISDDDFPREYDEKYWVYVDWDDGTHNSYRVGDVEFDLLFPNEKPPIKESDELDWIRSVEPTIIQINESYIMTTYDLQQFLTTVERELPLAKWCSGDKPTEYSPLSSNHTLNNSKEHYIKIIINDYHHLSYSSSGPEDFNNSINWP